MKKLLGCMCFVFLSWLASVVSTLSIAFFLESMGRTMSWYARPLWVFFLYVIPTLVVSMLAILLHAKLYNKVKQGFLIVLVLLYFFLFPGFTLFVMVALSTLLRCIPNYLDCGTSFRCNSKNSIKFHCFAVGAFRICR